MISVIGLGAGGHARVVIEILRLMDGVELVGLLDRKDELRQTDILGVPVLGGDELMPGLHRKGVLYALIGLGGTGDTGPRQRLYEKALGEGFEPVAAVHPQAVISPSAQIGKGPNVMAGAIINSAAILGDNVIVNTGAVVEHDCTIDDHVHIATGAKLASSVIIGEGAHVGVGAVVRQSIGIGEGAIVGAGAVVVRDVEPWSVVVGIPARLLRLRDPEGVDIRAPVSGSAS